MSPAIAIVLAALAVAAPPASRSSAAPASAAQDPDPAVRAGELFRLGEFEQAAIAFEEAYARSGDPALLFGRAQSLRRAGNCGGAIEVFEQFIATSPPAADVQAANDVIAACRSILGRDAADSEADAPAPEPTDAPSEPAPAPRRWPRDVAGGVLLGSGLTVTIAGAAIYGTAFARAAAERRETEQAYEARQRSTRTLAAAGASLMIGGTALLIGSVVRYVIVARRGDARHGRAHGPRMARRRLPTRALVGTP
jgi:tetratricopeptide (TPR) repeat protein